MNFTDRRMRCHASDFFSYTDTLSPLQIGIYIRLAAARALMRGNLPSNDRQLRRLAGDVSPALWRRNSPPALELLAKDADLWGPLDEYSAIRAERMAAARALGTHTDDEWQELLAFCGHRCVKCGDDAAPLHCDHIVPVASGGSDSIENIQPLCRACNCGKGPETTDYRPQGWRRPL